VLAQAIGRWGNWFNQELYGKATDLPWGLHITDPKGLEPVGYYHPTFLYECLWNLAVAALVLWADRRYRLGHGRAFALYVAAYTLGRLWIEALRIDDAEMIGPFRLNVWTSLIVCALAVCISWWWAGCDPAERTPSTAPATSRLPTPTPTAPPPHRWAPTPREAPPPPDRVTAHDRRATRAAGPRRQPARCGRNPARASGRHRRLAAPGRLRAMDGLVSNFALIAGVVGGTAGNSEAVVLAGLAGLAAGAFSMAAGEYTSVASQAEFAKAQIDVEREEIRVNGDAEQAELAAMYVAKGITPALAAEVATQVHGDLDNAVRVHAREEFGVDPDDLASPTLAAASSFIAFAVGAFLPVLPYLLGAATLLPAVVVSLLGLFACGAIVTAVTQRSWLFGGLRQLLLGGAAAGLTYLVGTAVGAGLG
jgi:VIT1/CCC1 family predicted Fe2+/Mn2+ transporter